MRKAFVDEFGLGPLRRVEYDLWEGCVTFPPTGEEVTLWIPGEAVERPEALRSAFEILCGRYVEGKEGIARALFDLYRPNHEHFDLDGDERGAPDPASAREMLELVDLFAVELGSPGHGLLHFAFREEAGWPDAMFTVSLDEEGAKGVALDD